MKMASNKKIAGKQTSFKIQFCIGKVTSFDFQQLWNSPSPTLYPPLSFIHTFINAINNCPEFSFRILTTPYQTTPNTYPTYFPDPPELNSHLAYPVLPTHLTYPPICPTHPPDVKPKYPENLGEPKDNLPEPTDNLPEPSYSFIISIKPHQAIPNHTMTNPTKFHNFHKISQF